MLIARFNRPPFRVRQTRAGVSQRFTQPASKCVIQSVVRL